MALFATNISCLHLVSLAQAGYDSGLLMGNFEWMAGFTLILLSLFFVPFYIRSKVATLPDFLEKRYCRECRDWLAVVSMVAAIVFHIAFPLSSGWIVLHGVFGIEKWTCILMICGLTALYTVLGGLAAVVMTETIQAIVLILGAVVITAFAYVKVGGWEAMASVLHSADESLRLSVLRSPAVEKEFPWFAIFLGYPVLGIWYWCADQTIVQRVLGAKDENHARIGPLFCAVIKILPVFIFVLPGLIFYVILKAGLLTGVKVENSKEVYGLMIKSLLADRPVRRDGGGLDGGPDGQPGQRGQLDLDPVQLRPLEAIPAGHARTPAGDHRPHGHLPVVRAGRCAGAAVGPLREHFCGDQRRDRPHRPAHHLRLHAGRVLGQGLGPQRQVHDVAGLGARARCCLP